MTKKMTREQEKAMFAKQNEGRSYKRSYSSDTSEAATITPELKPTAQVKRIHQALVGSRYPYGRMPHTSRDSEYYTDTEYRKNYWGYPANLYTQFMNVQSDILHHAPEPAKQQQSAELKQTLAKYKVKSIKDLPPEAIERLERNGQRLLDQYGGRYSTRPDTRTASEMLHEYNYRRQTSEAHNEGIRDLPFAVTNYTSRGPELENCHTGKIEKCKTVEEAYTKAIKQNEKYIQQQRKALAQDIVDAREWDIRKTRFFSVDKNGKIKGYTGSYNENVTTHQWEDKVKAKAQNLPAGKYRVDFKGNLKDHTKIKDAKILQSGPEWEEVNETFNKKADAKKEASTYSGRTKLEPHGGKWHVYTSVGSDWHEYKPKK